MHILLNLFYISPLVGLCVLVILAHLEGRFALRWSKTKLFLVKAAAWLAEIVTVTLSTLVLGTLILLPFAEPELPPFPITVVILLVLLMCALMFATEWAHREARKYGEKCRPQ